MPYNVLLLKYIYTHLLIYTQESGALRYLGSANHPTQRVNPPRETPDGPQLGHDLHMSLEKCSFQMALKKEN